MPLEKLSTFKAILWDMDGTLINSEPLWVEAEEELMAIFNTSWDEADQIACLGGPMVRVGMYMADKTNHQETPSFFATNLVKRMEMKLAAGVAYADGAKALFDSCFKANIPMALVTASSRSLVNAAMTSIGYERFAITISCDDVLESKPSPEGYCKAADLLGIDIRECLILEDSYVGVTAAIASGAAVIGISHLGELPNSPRLQVLPSLRDINLEKLQDIYGRLVFV